MTDCIREINNTQVDNSKDWDVAMLMHDLIECSDNYSKTLGTLCQYDRNELNSTLTYSESFKSKVKIIGNTPNDGNAKVVLIVLSLKCLSIF